MPIDGQQANLKVALELCSAQQRCLGVYDDKKDHKDVKFCVDNVAPDDKFSKSEATLWIKTGASPQH